MENQESVFKTLNSINVSEHIEKKGQLSYLSWVWAWTVLQKNYPSSSYKVYKNDQGWNYHTDTKTCWVEVGVTVEGMEHIEMLPVMDFKNKSVLFDNVTSMDVNKAIQRACTKCVARHGLGLYIYAGEDLPEEGTVSTSNAMKLSKLLDGHDDILKMIISHYKIKSLSELKESYFEPAYKACEKRIEAKNK